jgi:putative membrane protein
MGMLLIFLVGYLGYLVAQAQRPQENDQADLEAPIDALKKRYARGEITREEYEKAKKVVQNKEKDHENEQNKWNVC